MPFSTRTPFVATVLLLLVACSGQGNDPVVDAGEHVDQPDASDVSDAGDLIDAGADAGVDGGVEDGGVEDGGRDGGETCVPTADRTCPGGAGCACTTGEDCTGGVCGWSADGGRACAAPCEPCCADGERCGSIDDKAVCVPAFATLCQPCQDDDACRIAGDRTARCAKAGPTESFCGTSCVETDCPSGYECKDLELLAGGTAKLCVPAAGAACACNTFGAAVQASTLCQLDGQCVGTRVCGLSNDAPTLLACARDDSARDDCDGIDNDCDGVIDEGCDDDKDGYCRVGARVLAGAGCAAGDCNDADGAMHPGVTDAPGDGIDLDCDGQEVCYVDADGDGARTEATRAISATACPASAGVALASAPIDCDDSSEAAHPGATEVPGDGIDQDCDGHELCFIDADKDGARSSETRVGAALTCDREEGLAPASSAEDCNDADPDVRPGLEEDAGDEHDRDCDGRELCFVDADGDGHRTESTTLATGSTCKAEEGFATAEAPLDCDDTNGAVHSGATELSDDGIDSNCDGIELFDGDPLAVVGTMGTNSFTVSLSGSVPMPLFGEVAVTGTASRAAPGAPVLWCIAGPVARSFDGFSFEGTATVCRTTTASPAVLQLAGTATADGTRFTVNGAALRTAPFDLELVPSGTVTIRGDDYAIASDPAQSSFRVNPLGSSWRVAADRDRVLLDPLVPIDAVKLVLSTGSVALDGVAVLGSGEQQARFKATGNYGTTGAYALDLAQVTPLATFQPFTSAELPQRLRAFDATGSIDGDGAGHAEATVTAESFCAGDCCTARVDGSCEVPAMARCVEAKLPECASAWTEACVQALGTCDLKLANAFSLKTPHVELTVGEGVSWDAQLAGTASMTGYEKLDVPPLTMRSVVGSCRAPIVRHCACEVDSGCCLDGWNDTCDTIVTTQCGGLAALDKCGDGELFLHAEIDSLWQPGLGALGAKRFALRDTWWDMHFVPVAAQAGVTRPEIDPASWNIEGGARADAVLCMSGNCSQQWIETAPRGSLDAAEGATVVPIRGVFTTDAKYLVAPLADLHIPIFELPVGAAMVFSSTPLPVDGDYFDVMDTPDEPLDDMVFQEGLSLGVFGPAGIPIPDEQFNSLYPVPMWAVSANVRLGGVSLEAWGRFDWTLVPKDVLPTIDTLKLQYIRAYATMGLGDFAKAILSPVTGGTANFFGASGGSKGKKDFGITLGLEAGAQLQPSNQLTPLNGRINMEFLPDRAGGILGGNVWLQGKWKEPFGIADFALQGLAMTMYLNIESGMPVAFGASRALFWRPPSCEWPSELLDWQYDSGCLTAYKYSVLFMPATDYLFHWEIGNLDLNAIPGMLNSLSKTAVNGVNYALKQATDPTLIWAKLFKDMAWDPKTFDAFKNLREVPPLQMPTALPNFQGFNMTLKNLRLSYSPKPVSRWGQDFVSGGVLHANLDINSMWHGEVYGELSQVAMVPTGLHLFGDIDPIKIGDLQLLGDPFARAVVLNGGYLTIPHDAALNPLATTDELGTSVRYTVEGLVRKTTWAPNESATLYEKNDGTNGITVRLARLGRSASPAPETQYEEVDFENGRQGLNTDGRDPGEERAWLVLEVRNGGQVRTYKSERGVLPGKDAWQHVAVSLRGLEATGVIEGKALLMVAEGAQIEPGATSVPARAGQGLQALDELRVWRSYRQPEDLNLNRRYLGTSTAQRPELVLRYTFDWDTGAVANNSRNLRALDGAFAGGAHTEAFADDKIAWKTTYKWATWPPTAEMSLLAGARVPLPLPTPLVFRLWHRLSSESLKGAGEFYAAPLVPLRLPWGDFRITGRGPNGLYDDFDDGLYGAIEVAPGMLGLDGSGRLDFLPQSGGRDTVGQAEVFLGCPPGETCASFPEYDFRTLASIDLPMHAPGLPLVRLAGSAQIDNRTNAMDVIGFLEVDGLRISSSTIHVDNERMSLATSLDLGPIFGEILGPANVRLEMQYSPFELCGAGELRNAADTESICDVDVCLNFADPLPKWELRSLQCFGLCWNDAMCGENQFCDLVGQCWDKKPLGAWCAGIWVGAHECQSGFCDPWKTAADTGTLGACSVPLDDWIGCTDGAQCKSGHCGTRPGKLAKHCYTPGLAKLGEECVDTLHCGEGQCWGTVDWGSRCLCENDAQCAASAVVPAGRVCKKGTWGQVSESGFCIPPRRAGEDCTDISDCAAGLKCGGGKCYVANSKHNWENCTADEECIGGNLCWDYRCRCFEHSQCSSDPAYGANSYCDKGTWTSTNEEGHCRKPKRPDGDYCEDDVWCASGRCGNGKCFTPSSKHSFETCNTDAECIGGSQCWNGRCRCYEHAQCAADGAYGANSYCDKGTWLTTNEEGHCRSPKRPDGDYCEDGAWCASGHCGSGKCFTPASRHNWETCNTDAECIGGGLCWNGRCRCYEHSHCQNDWGIGGNSFCNKGDWQTWNEEGRCLVPKRGNGEYCEDDAWCASGACGGGVCFQPRSVGNWGGCSDDRQCANGACYAGQCRCWDHSQCTNELGGNGFCDMGTWAPGNSEGRCRSDKGGSNNNTYCEDGAWCQSGLCGWSPKWNRNNCFTYAGFARDNWCDLPQNCVSGSCSFRTTWWGQLGWWCD